MIKTQFQSSGYIEQGDIALPQSEELLVYTVNEMAMKRCPCVRNQWKVCCVIAGRMINWCLDDELWIHPGFLAAACHIDGTGNEGNNEGRFRRMWNGRNNRNICASLQLGYN